MREKPGSDWPRTGMNGFKGRRFMPCSGVKRAVHDDDDDDMYTIFFVEISIKVLIKTFI